MKEQLSIVFKDKSKIDVDATQRSARSDRWTYKEGSNEETMDSFRSSKNKSKSKSIDGRKKDNSFRSKSQGGTPTPKTAK